jgi:hypothetical protein
MDATVEVDDSDFIWDANLDKMNVKVMSLVSSIRIINDQQLMGVVAITVINNRYKMFLLCACSA